MRNIYFLILLFNLFPVSISAHMGSNLSLPIVFVPNQGQFAEEFLYKGISSFADIYLEQDGVTYVVGHANNSEKRHDMKFSGDDTFSYTLQYHAYKVKWLNSGKEATSTTPGKKQNYYHNYFLGNDTSRWKGKVPVYGNVNYNDIYPNIDLYWSSEKGNAKYDFIVKKGGDPQNIQLQFEGLDGIELQKENLILLTSVGEIIETAPFAYQFINGERKTVACRYRLKDGVVSFVFPKGYDKNETLIIDPEIIFSSLTGSVADNWGFTTTYDEYGNLYGGGIANASNYPVTLGAFQEVFAGGGGITEDHGTWDVVLSKFNAIGNDLVYSTFLGGSMNEMPHSTIVDYDGNLIVVGKTKSINFPVTSAAAYPNFNGGNVDFFITKFDSSGAFLLASTYLGGTGDDGVNVQDGFGYSHTTLRYNYGDNYRGEVNVDRQNNVYMVGSTQSNNFPTTSNAVKSTLGGVQDGVFVKMNPQLSTLMYSTYIGGVGMDAAYVLALDTGENYVYVAGGTMSADFHLTSTLSGWQSNYQGGMSDGYICRFRNGGNYTMTHATYIGTNSYDQCFGIQIDNENNVYSMGQTLGAFPVLNANFSNPGSTQFVIKLDSLLNNLYFSTVYGNGVSAIPNISPVAFLVDTCQNIYISGWGANSVSLGTTTNNMPITPNAFQSTTDGQDFYFIVIGKNAQDLLFGSFFGANGKYEHVDGGTSRFDPNGVVYQSMCASCRTTPISNDYPYTPGAYSTTKGSVNTNCNMGVVKIAFNLGVVNAKAEASPKTTGCAPLTVTFSNGSSNATSYLWDFDDGTQSSVSDPIHTFTAPGVYKVMLAAYNPNACIEHDTTYLEIVVSTDTISADFEYAVIDSCEKFIVQFTNTSSFLPFGNSNNTIFEWFFGDGTSFLGQNPTQKEYATGGTYNILLVMTDTLACNSPDSVWATIYFNPLFVTSKIEPIEDACVGTEYQFKNLSDNGADYSWDFGDGTASSSPNPKHKYDAPGNYTIRLITSNPASCNGADTAYVTITIYANPKASFSYAPVEPEPNMPTSFKNHSLNAIQYRWDFGDGTQSNEVSPTHSYARSGSYQVCLTAYGENECSDKVCAKILSRVESIADVPNAFSPNGDGNNDMFYVRGYNIETLEFKIFNRWGELVFETKDQNVGWDGTYNNVPQEMDAYAYTMYVVFKDGTSLSRQGNITLLR